MPCAQEISDYRNDEVLAMCRAGDWCGVVEYLCKGEHKPLLLWPRPTINAIEFIEKHLKRNNINRLLSLGCGTGLLEWIIQCAVKELNVIGVEVDEEWWSSVYAPPVFHPLNYPNDSAVTESLLNESTALLFCYFNCEPAWMEYLAKFKGSLIIVCGPVLGSGTHSNPQPFQSLTEEWTVVDGIKIGNTHDSIAIYARIK
ncbi:uncharacterized protein LOC132201461 [Neocloeon triangulifer]|uniref:uncharacterized protein LOC132201461 n=1 Tax=Neocloeon triangulifer TaxID=2078957 RepID=UPI00286F10F9|nr:uncharacterized protein LOC132201461 [Neocloeon triangulifer]